MDPACPATGLPDAGYGRFRTKDFRMLRFQSLDFEESYIEFVLKTSGDWGPPTNLRFLQTLD